MTTANAADRSRSYAILTRQRNARFASIQAGQDRGDVVIGQLPIRVGRAPSCAGIGPLTAEASTGQRQCVERTRSGVESVDPHLFCREERDSGRDFFKDLKIERIGAEGIPGFLQDRVRALAMVQRPAVLEQASPKILRCPDVRAATSGVENSVDATLDRSALPCAVRPHAGAGAVSSLRRGWTAERFLAGGAGILDWHRSYPFGEPRSVQPLSGHSRVNYTASYLVGAA